MAVDEDDVNTVRQEVKFDGDWAKAAAIDAALTYGLLAVYRSELVVKSQLTGRVPIDAQDFTWITAIFEEVLLQRGYVVDSAEHVELVDEGVEKLLKKIGELKGLLSRQNDRVFSLEEECGRSAATLRERDTEIKMLREQLAVSEDPEDPEDPEESGAGDTFKASKCGGLNPYRASNGAPCMGVVGTAIPGVMHQDKTGFRWSADNGVSEEVARRLQADYAAQTDELAEFEKSACDGLNPYRSTDGIPCLLLGAAHGGGPHWSNKDGVGYSWYDHQGVDEETARVLQQAAKGFQKSQCEIGKPYRASNGSPCVGNNHNPDMQHIDNFGYKWWVHEGVDEKTARGLQQQASKPQ